MYVYNSVFDPVSHPLGDSSMFLADAHVTLSSTDWQLQLVPDLDGGRRWPVFSTQGQSVVIKPGETYRLSVEWNAKYFWAETTVPLAPAFKNIDSVLTIRNDKVKLSWESPYAKHIIVVDFPARKLWGGRYLFFQYVDGWECECYAFIVDSVGVATAIVYAYNEDYEKYLLLLSKNKYRKDPTAKLYSNIHGAHGIFSAMAADTMTFRYRVE